MSIIRNDVVTKINKLCNNAKYAYSMPIFNIYNSPIKVQNRSL